MPAGLLTAAVWSPGHLAAVDVREKSNRGASLPASPRETTYRLAITRLI